jgi:4a-hydroxytetrahydrobiopterin dehydratase
VHVCHLARYIQNQEVEAKLKAELPHWFLENGWIRRKYKTSGWKATLMVVSFVVSI